MGSEDPRSAPGVARWSMAPRGGDVHHADIGLPTRIDRMSDHTERLRKLRARIVAAKEFL